MQTLFCRPAELHRMAAAIKYLLEASEAYDFYFIVGPQKERVGVVRTLLANCSQPLHRMLLSSDPKHMKETEYLPDGHVDAINILLKYAYGAADSNILCGELTGWSGETALHVVYLADRYQVHPLKAMALDQLVPTTVDNLFPALHCVFAFDARIRDTTVLKIVQEQTDKVLAHPDFLKIDVNSLIFILKQDVLRLNDLELWMAALAWAKYQVPGATKDPVIIRRLLQKPLQHIRLYTLTREEFWQHVEPANVFLAKELVDYIRAVDNQQFSDNKLFSNRIEKRRNTTSVDLDTHDVEILNERVSECKIKLEKKAKVNTVFCHGRSGSPDCYRATVVLRLYGDSDPDHELAQWVRTVECEVNEVIALTQLEGVGDVVLSAGCEYWLYVQFSEPHPAKASVQGDCYYCHGHHFDIERLDCIKYKGPQMYSTHFKRIRFTCL